MADIQYPTWRYHATESPKVVHDEAEDEALGDEWTDSPAAFVSDDKQADIAADPELAADAPVEKPKRGRRKKEA